MRGGGSEATEGIQQENEICIILRRYIVIMNNSIRFYRFVLLKIHKTLNSEGGLLFSLFNYYVLPYATNTFTRTHLDVLHFSVINNIW